MARPQVAGGGDGLQIQTAVSNILSKQLWTAQNGYSNKLDVESEDNN
jgi:hypothetical protein